MLHGCLVRRKGSLLLSALPVLSCLFLTVTCHSHHSRHHPPANLVTVVDSSGDISITLHADSSTQVTITWQDPTAKYTMRPDSYTCSLYRDGLQLVPSTQAFTYIDGGLSPGTFYRYRAEVTAWYTVIVSPVSYGWSSATAAISTFP